MLERTAGCLESGSLLRLLPISQKPLKSRSIFHSARWNHRVPDLEISPSWQALVHCHDGVGDQEGKATAASAGIFLDFLYPLGAINHFRNCPSWQYGAQRLRPRKYAFGRVEQRRHASRATKEKKAKRQQASLMSNDQYELYGEPEPEQEDVEDIEEPSDAEELSYIEQLSPEDELEKLSRILEKRSPRDFEEAWRLHSLLTAQDRAHLVPSLLTYLSQSERDVDAERAIRLFDMIAASSNLEMRQAVLRAICKLGDISKATLMLEVFMTNFRSADGCDEVFTAALTSRNWPELIRIWEGSATFNRLHENVTIDCTAKIPTLPDIQNHALAYAEFLETQVEDTRQLFRDRGTTSGMAVIAEYLTTTALLREDEQFSPFKVLKLLDATQRWGIDDYLPYKDLILMYLQRKNFILAKTCYYRYREREEAAQGLVDAGILTELLGSLDTPAEVDMIFQDYVKYHGEPQRHFYYKALWKLARKADVATVLRLWDRWMENRDPVGTMESRADDITPVLHALARRGRVAEAARLFDGYLIENKVTPSISAWNILINAYGKANDMDGAFKRFQQLLDSSEAPDHYTFGTLMFICIAHGDFLQAMELYQMSESLGVERSPAMLSAVVLGNIQEGRLSQATKICLEAAQVYDGDCTPMWNLLLTAYAFRRDISRITEILRQMKELNIAYDGDTYAALMQGLAMTRQPNQAYDVLKDVMPGSGVRPTQFHYAIVMGGFLATRELQRVFHVHNRMTRHRLGSTTSTRLLALKTVAIMDQNDGLDAGWNEITQEVHLERAEKLFEDAMSNSNPMEEAIEARRKGTGRQALNAIASYAYFDYMMFVYGQVGAFKRVRQLYEIYEERALSDRRAEPPLKILTALMRSNFNQKNFEGVQQCWNIASESAKRTSAPFNKNAAGGSRHEVLPIHRYMLSIALTIQMQSLASQNRFHDLSLLVDDVHHSGFALDRKNWNLYIQLLVSGRRYKSAFELCETKLMPGFLGWARVRWQAPVRNRLPMETRIWKKDLRNLRPTSFTLMFLGRALLDLEDGSLGSRAAQRVVEELVKACPKTVHAVKTMQRTDSETERLIFTKA